MKHKGSCHCGTIRYEVEGNIESLMECNCSHCSRKGYLLWFIPKTSVHLLTPESALATYTFNKHAINHHFCPSCGCAPFGFGEHGGVMMAAINARCLEDVDLAGVEIKQVDGKSF